MSLLRLFVQRILLGLVAAWGLLTAIFVLFTATNDWVVDGIVGNLRFVQADDSEIDAAVEEYVASRGLDRSLSEQYFDWITSMLTLEWGNSFASGDPAIELVTAAVFRTATYVLPAVVIAIALGTLIGLYAALRSNSILTSSGVTTAYVLFALPNFWLGGMIYSLDYGGAVSLPEYIFAHVLPIALTCTALLGGYVSYARSHSLAHVHAESVSLVKAKGGSQQQIAAHVVRNAAIPLFSMLFTEALSLLVLAVFVIEVLFGIQGIGFLLFESVYARDLPVILGGMLVIVATGVVANILQDISYTILDPRVDTGVR